MRNTPIRFLLTFSCYLICSSLSAQDYTPKFGAPQKLPGGFNTPMYNLGIMNGDYYISFVNRNANTIQRYSANHKFLGKQELVIQKGKKNLAIREVLHTKAGYFGYSGYYNSKDKTYSLIAYDLENGKFKNRRKIFTQPIQLRGLRSATGGYVSIFNRKASQVGIPKSDFVMSKDSNFIAFHNLISDKTIFAEDKIMVGLFDKELNQHWKKEQSLEYQDRDLSIVQAAVSQRGEIFVLGKLFERRRQKNRRLPRYDYKIFHITKDDFNIYDVKLKGDNAPTDAGLFIPPAEDVAIVGGMYTNSERRGGLIGTFLYRLEIDAQTTSSKLYKFRPRDLEQIENTKRIAKGRGLNENRYDINEFISFEDGSMAMVAEASWITTFTNNSPTGGVSTTTIYHSDAIIMPTFSADGELEKIGVIDKHYSSSSALNRSYGLGWDQGRACLVYNDSKTGRERREIGKKGSLFTDMTIFSPYGEEVYQGTIFNNKDIKSLFVPRMTTIREGKLMLVGLRLGKFQVGIIDM